MSYQGNGRTDKAGNRYEINFCIQKLIEIIEEEICSITIESVGADERCVDVWVKCKDGRRKGLQCKGRNQNKDNWTTSELDKYDIWNSWKFQLDRSSEVHVGLVSPISYILLEDLISLAKNSSGNVTEFYEHQIKKASKEMKNFYSTYCSKMKLDENEASDILKSLDYLNRTHYCQVPDTELKNLILTRIKYLFCENENEVYDALLDYIINGDVWGKEINLINLKKYLGEKNIHLSNLAMDDRISPRFDMLNKEFDRFFIPINGEVIEREEYVKCKEIIEKGESVIISGKAGYGKSGIVQLIATDCKERDIPYIAMKLDKRVPEKTSREWGNLLGLPASLSFCLDAISKDKKAVIILDQLDALRWTQSNSREALFVCREIIDEVENLNLKRENKISIVFICRTYDLNYDNNIKNLFENTETRWNKIQVDKFSKKDVKKIIGEQYEKNSGKLNELLEIPSNLYIWTKLDKSKSYDNCYTTNKLIGEWWFQLNQKADEINFDLKQCMSEIVGKMNAINKMRIMKKSIKAPECVLTFLTSNGLLILENDIISFTHQRILDYFLEIEMIEKYYEGNKVEEIIGNVKQQTPRKRYQTQMFLEDLSDISIQEFLRIGKEILDSDNIRFYIKYVFFEVLGQLKTNDEIANFILRFYNDDKFGKHIITNVVYSNIDNIKVLLRNGIIDDWLISYEKQDLAINLLKSILEVHDDEIVDFFEKNLFKSEELDKKIFSCFSFKVSEEIDSKFNLRMKIYEKYPKWSEEYIDLKSLFKSNEMRAIEILEFWLANRIDNKHNVAYKHIEEIIEEDSNFIITKDIEIIERLLRFIPKEKNVYYGDWSARYKYNFGIERTCVNIIKKANKKLIKNNPELFWKTYEDYMGKEYSVFNEIILEGFMNFTGEYSDKIINYLSSDLHSNILDFTSGNNDELLLTKNILEKHTQTCSDSVLKKLENKIYYFYEKSSIELYKRTRKYNMNVLYSKMPWDWWGNLQVELIPHLEQKRINKKTKELLDVLQRRFKCGSNYYKQYGGHSGSVFSPISGKNLSDKQWIKLLSNEKIRTNEKNEWKEVEGGFVESNLREFANSFADSVSKEPLRMIKLFLENGEKFLREYVEALYNGIHNSEKLNDIPNDMLEKLFVKFPCDDESQIAKYVCWIIRKKEDTNWSNNVSEILKDIALKHKDPELGKPNVTSNEDREMKSAEMLQSNSLNCTRGVAARTISHLIWGNSIEFQKYKETILWLSKDENPAVRLATLYPLYSSYNLDSNWTKEIVLKLFKEDERFLTFVEARRLLFLMFETHKKYILEIIERAYFSDDKDVKRVGAWSVAEVYITKGEFDELIRNFQSMDEVQEECIITMIENYFDRTEYNEKCKNIMLEFSRNNRDVENFVNAIFVHKKINIKRDKEFLIEMVRNNFSRRTIHNLLKYIEENALSIIDFSEVILEILNSYIYGEEDKELSYFYGDELSKLVVALYDETEGKNDSKMISISEECLNIWDKMFEKQIGIIKQLSRDISDR